MQSLGVLSRQLKHVLVLFMESIRGSLAGQETHQAKENKKKFLLG